MHHLAYWCRTCVEIRLWRNSLLLSAEEPTVSRDQPDDSDDDEPEERLPTTFHHADTCLKDLRRVLVERGNTDTEFTLFYAFERQIHQLFAATKRQAKVTGFVGWIP
jgi:hypothetical protein